jgi:polysaccharide biosynthesis protein PslH
MRVLWFSHFVPFPPKGGAHQRSFNLLRSCSRSHEVFLVAFNLQGEPNERLAEYTSELKKYCEEVELWPLPVPWRSVRWWTGLAFSPFSPYPYGSQAFWSRQLSVRWNEILCRYPGALVHYDSIDLGLFAHAATGFRKVLNHHNCESEMAHSRARWEPNPVKKGYLWLQARKIASLERAVCHRFEVNIAVSELEARRLRRSNPKAHIHLVENGTDVTYFQPANIPEVPRSLIFSGTLNWYPNISAIQFFVREAWPLIKQQCPDVRLYVAGNKPSDSLCRWLKQDSNIVVVPSPEDIRPWIERSSVCVCPFRDGGGTKLKILDAMAMAKPVVATTKGCEGLRVTHRENILVADNPRDFALEVIRALDNKLLRRQLGMAGRVLVERHYGWEVIGFQLEQAYRCALTVGSCNHEVTAL